MSSQREAAYQQIKDMIFRMELLPGDRIPEQQIAAKLSISRTPIHDALRRLESDGLVTINPNRGASVTFFAEDAVKEIGTIRIANDILAAQLAAYYGSAADFEQLYHLADVCETAAVKGDIFARISADVEFHLAIVRLSGNSRLISQQSVMYQQIHLHLIQISKFTDVEQHSLIKIQHHRPIVDAIRSGDQRAIRSIICQHTKDFYQIDPYLLKCYDGSDE